MVTQYNQRLEEARLELAENIRRRIKQAIEEGCPYLDIIGGSLGSYYVIDGKLHSFKKSIAPGEIPLENYGVPTLLGIVRRVKAE